MLSKKEKTKSDKRIVEETLRNFELLKITPKQPDEPSSSQTTLFRKRSHSCTVFTISDSVSTNLAYICNYFLYIVKLFSNSQRFRPYALPKISRLTVSSATALKPRLKVDELDCEEGLSDTDDKASPSIKAKEIKEPYQSCSQQASSKNVAENGSSDELEFAIDELSEYFDHLVNVGVKMSDSAAAMYA
jgi:hypothetical protein